jgi:hypothetical protein
MIFRIDYHFHPNLPRNQKRALSKCKKWWKTLENININTIIVTEHCYKNPERAFKLMKETKPTNFFIFPGMEYLTKEGIDLIIFSQSEKIYNYKELKPYNLTFAETINFILKNNLASYITHPYTLGLTSIIPKLGQQKYSLYTNKLRAVEVSNSSLGNLYKLLKKPILKTLFSKKIKMIERNFNIPKEDYPKQIQFLAAGSDAHHPEELGTFVTINTTPKDLFKRIITNKKPLITIKEYHNVNYWLLLKTAITTFKEFMLKRFV